MTRPLLTALLFGCALLVGAGCAARPVPRADTSCEGAALDALMGRLATAYSAARLAKVDAELQPREPIQVLVEHSLAGATESELFPTFASVDTWLGERKTLTRAHRPLEKCGKGRCAYDFSGGIDHNTLYLHHVLYECRAGRPYVLTLAFLDGD